MKNTILLSVCLFFTAFLLAKAQDDFEYGKKIVPGHTTVKYTRSDNTVYIGKLDSRVWKEVVPPPPGETNEFREMFCTKQVKKVYYYTANGKAYSTFNNKQWKREEKKGPKLNLSEQTGSSFEITVMPNPAKDFLKIQYTLSENNYATAGIYSLQGVELLSIPSTKAYQGFNELRIDLSSLQSGTYYLKVQAGPHVITKSLTVIK